jgi:hypothetical protein
MRTFDWQVSASRTILLFLRCLHGKGMFVTVHDNLGVVLNTSSCECCRILSS